MFSTTERRRHCRRAREQHLIGQLSRRWRLLRLAQRTGEGVLRCGLISERRGEGEMASVSCSPRHSPIFWRALLAKTIMRPPDQHCPQFRSPNLLKEIEWGSLLPHDMFRIWANRAPVWGAAAAAAGAAAACWALVSVFKTHRSEPAPGGAPAPATAAAPTPPALPTASPK